MGRPRHRRIGSGQAPCRVRGPSGRLRRAQAPLRCLFQTDLDLTLRELGVDTLVVMGCDTNICVMHTLAGAYFRGYRTVVPAEATATFLVGDQQEGLSYFARCFDTRVVCGQEALGLFA